MKANEFRIGNWVLGSSGKIFIRIDYINFDRIGMRLSGGYGGLLSNNYEETLSFCKPIPLTPEILNSKVDDMWYDKFSNSWTKGILSLAPRGDGYYSDPDHYEGISYNPIQFVHELQNLYHALTGEELNIQL